MEQVRHILEQLLDADRYEFGLADMRGLMPGENARYAGGVSIIRSLDRAIIDSIKNGPTREYLDHYHAINGELSRTAESVAEKLCATGLHARSIRATFFDHELDDSYVKTLRTPVSHKMVATRAGLGWIGKTGLLVSFRFGPRVRLASVLVEEELAGTGTPVAESMCGACDVCVQSCPGGAGSGESWRAGFDRDRFFNAFKCREACRRLSKERLDEEISLCGLCVALCPRGAAAMK